MVSQANHARKVTVLLGLLACFAGCHRSFYREQADAEAYQLVREKATSPHWPMERYWIEIDPRSRMFDPFNLDRPPMPPDDPDSHRLMHCVDYKPGYPHWHANGDTPFVENPDWLAYLDFDENGVLSLESRQAYQLALIHSRDFQRQFETLYLSALDVSSERFRFDTQFFAGYSADHRVSGAEHPDGPRNELAVETFTQQTGRLGLPAGGVSATTPASRNNGLLLRKSFITGADLAVGLANSLVWNFNGVDEHTAITLLDFSLLQPLLRRAGRDRILEQLTIAERALLANVRQMERYRRAFYVEIMTGRDAGAGATRRGGFFGASGLEGFTGVGGGGFGGIGGTASTSVGGTGAAQAGGYFGLLQDQQDIRNQQVTITGLRSNLVQLNESLRENLARIPDDPETILRERLQIAQARQALLNAESRLLNTQAAYQSSLDGFKTNLGLPPALCVNVDDAMLEPFNLIDPEMLRVQNEVAQLRASIGDLNEQLLNAVEFEEVAGRDVPTLQWSEALQGFLQRLKDSVVRAQAIRDQVGSVNLERARQDILDLEEAVPERRQQLLNLTRVYRDTSRDFQSYGNLDPCQMALLADIDPIVLDGDRLARLPAELQGEADRVLGKFREYDRPLAEMVTFLDNLLGTPTKPPPAELYAQIEQQVLFAVPSQLADLSDDLLDLSLVQARARTEAVRLKPIELDWQLAVEIARRYRRDWMNARAALVDSWRLIEFNADNLESTLDVVFDGELRNTGDNPIRLRDVNGQLRAGLRFDAPLTRLQERNTYRQALIEYSQARRDYYAFVDAVTRGLRNTLRQITLNQINFEERRIAVLSAIDQVVLNDQIQKLREERGLETGVTAARDVVSALQDFQNAQNDFLSVWINFEVQRLNLDLDLGTMRLDAEGEWIDPGPLGPEYGYPLPDWELGGSEMRFEAGEMPGLLPAEGGPVEALPPGVLVPMGEDEAQFTLPGEAISRAVGPTGILPASLTGWELDASAVRPAGGPVLEVRRLPKP